MKPEAWDVVILGGGMASLCMARLLSREAPGASVLTLDKATAPRRKVGESTVEIGAHFLNARLGLGDVLARTQLPKNGLRFWFDSPERDLTFQDASEDGPATFAYWRTYQLERGTIERSILDLNRAAGVTDLWGIRGLEVERGAGDAPHKIRFRAGDAARDVRARWLVDATGNRSFHGRAQDNLIPEDRLTNSACWAWFEGVPKVDDLIDVNQGVARSIWAPRFLSTNHLLGEGYWIWMIPLASGLYSIGLGYDHTVITDPPRNPAQFVAFLRRHRMLDQLLAGASEPIDFGALKNFSFRPKEYLSADRVAYTGMAAGFVDPFFSNGVDMIALTCELAADLITRDLAGEGVDPQRLAAHETTLALTYEHFLTSVKDVYPTYVSQELSHVRYRRDVHVYWAIYVWPYFADRLRNEDPEFLAGWHALSKRSTLRGQFFSALLVHGYEQLKERGLLYRGNRGQFTFNQLGFRNTPYVRFEQQMGHVPDLARMQAALGEIDVACFLGVVDVLFDADRSPLRRLLVEAIAPIHDDLVELWQALGFNDAYWEQAFARIDASIQGRLAAEGIAIRSLDLDGEVYRRLLPRLLERCASPEDALLVRKHFNQVPALADFADLPPSRDHAQPRAAWSVDHTPWLDAVPEFTSAYDLLGETWWNDTAQAFSALVDSKAKSSLKPTP